MTPRAAIDHAAGELAKAGLQTAHADAERLVAHIVDVADGGLSGAPCDLEPVDVERLRALVARRCLREPLAYLLGQWRFRRLTLKVDGCVLIPRAETEFVVERCLRRIRRIAEPRVVDVGVGSGAIALAIADEHPGARVSAVDCSPRALGVARHNAKRTGLADRVTLVEGDLFGGLPGPFDLVVSNPPYVAPGDFGALPAEIRLYEPYEAVVGTDMTRKIAVAGLDVLRPGGWLILECASGQAEAVSAELRALGYERVRPMPDGTGANRIVEGRRV